MKTICAWCGTVLGDDPDLHVTLGELELVSHGICDPCAEQVESDAKDSKARREPACQRAAGL